MNACCIIFSSYKYHRCTVQNKIWMCVLVLCQRYTRYTGEITWKTTSKTTESTSQNNRLFLKTNPLLLLQKQKQQLLQRQQRKLSRKKIFLLVRRTSRPEREAFFLGQDDSCQETDGCTGGFCVTLGTPPQLRAGRVRSSGYWLKSGVTGGCYPSLGSSGEAGSIQPGCPRITATILS